MPSKFPNILYHYTSSQVLLSILKHRSIWLGSRWHVNDFDEGGAFDRLIRSYAKKMEIKDESVNRVTETLARLECYVNCMSRDADMLSQWRGYAAQGAGFSIGFKSAALLKAIKGTSEALLYPVTYADDYADLGDMTKKLIVALLKSPGEPPDNFIQSAAKEKWAVKNKAFEEEHEYRLILTPKHDAGGIITFPSGETAERKYRATETDVREYYELSLTAINPNDLISEIVLGPKNVSNPEALKRQLKELGFDNIVIRKSAATYR